jgi:hypothetical protein
MSKTFQFRKKLTIHQEYKKLKNTQTTTDTYLSLPLIKYRHKLCSEIYYVIWDVIYKINR